MNVKRRKQCDGKARWPSMKAAHAYCFHRRHVGVHIRPYHCRHCGGIHVGHFRQDELPEVVTTMSKTRVYAVFFGDSRESPIFLDRQEAEDALAHYGKPVLMEKDINEEEYAQLAVYEIEGQQRARARDWQPSEHSRPVPSDSYMDNRGWTDCATRPQPPLGKRVSR